MLISLDGIDGSGKATQSAALAERFRAHTGRAARVFSFPNYESPTGREALRYLQGLSAWRDEHTINSSDPDRDGAVEFHVSDVDALVFQCLLLANKCEAAEGIRALLRDYVHVICDRWTAAAICYGSADGVDPAWTELVHTCLPRPEINIFIDVPPEEALRRRPEMHDRYERDRKKQEAVRKNYAELWQRNAGPAWVKIDGIGSVEKVTDRIWTAILRKVRL